MRGNARAALSSPIDPTACWTIVASIQQTRFRDLRKRRFKEMELAITQNAPLRLARRQLLKYRKAFFDRSRIAALRLRPDVWRDLRPAEMLAARPVHLDNGR
jgi:hypothetical protein